MEYEASPQTETTKLEAAPRVIDLAYIRQLKILPDCPFDHPLHDFDGENIGA